MVGVVEVTGVFGVVNVVKGVEVIRMVEVIRVVEVVYRYEEILGVKGPKSNNKDVGLRMTMPQAAGKNSKFYMK